MINLFTKYAWTKLSKTTLNGFHEIVNKSKRKPNKIWVDQGREFAIASCKNSQMIMIFYCTLRIGDKTIAA